MNIYDDDHIKKSVTTLDEMIEDSRHYALIGFMVAAGSAGMTVISAISFWADRGMFELFFSLLYIVLGLLNASMANRCRKRRRAAVCAKTNILKAAENRIFNVALEHYSDQANAAVDDLRRTF